MLKQIVFATAAISASSAFAAEVTTVAGNGPPGGYTQDEIPATTAAILSPRGLSVAADGTVYFSDLGNNRVRSVDPAGIIHTVVGTGAFANFPGDGDGGPATSATIAGVF